MSAFISTIATHFASYFAHHQVIQRTIQTDTAYWAHSTMIVNVRSGATDTCYDVHPLVLWILRTTPSRPSAPTLQARG